MKNASRETSAVPVIKVYGRVRRLYSVFYWILILSVMILSVGFPASAGLSHAMISSDTTAVAAPVLAAAVAPSAVQQFKAAVRIAGKGSGSVSSSPAGISCPGDCSEAYGRNSVVTLTAAPAAGSMFSGWSGACTGSALTCNVTMTAAKSATAVFTLYPALTVTKAGSGTGAITSNDNGISCGNVPSPDCSEFYTAPDTVVLTAAPALHSSIAGWTGCGSVSADKTTCTVSMTGSRKVKCAFTADPKYKLTVKKAGAGTGSVTSSPSGISCPGDCTESYWKHEVVTLTAAPAAGSMFSGWGGACTGSALTCNVTMTAAKSVTASFVPDLIGDWNVSGEATVTAIISGHGSETVTEIVYDEFVFFEDGLFEMTDMAGVWTLKGDTFTVNLSPSDIEYYFEENLSYMFGVDVYVTVQGIKFTGRYNSTDDTIAGTVSLTGMKLNIPAYGLSGTVTERYTFTGTRAVGAWKTTEAEAISSKPIFENVIERMRDAVGASSDR